jgi:ribonuclease R
VQEEWFGRTVIHSTRRFSYEEVQAILYAGHGEHFAELNTLNQIAHQLREQRFARGSIGFETDEVRFRLDAEGRPLELYVKERFDAHKLIEDFMLLANRRVAALVARKRPPVPFPYRVHPTPLPEKLAALQDFVARFGHTLHLPDTEPQTVADALNKLTAAVQGRPEQNIVQSMSIRSMPKAIYTTDNDGHYGLGFADYCHFTSPIRRYPDVLAHRILTDVLENRPSLGKSVLEEMCKHSSEREKVAADAERASIRFKMAEYMQQRIGQVLQGAISGITDWGLYIELRESKIEGMAWVSELPGDRWQPDDKLHYLEGLHTRQRLYLGDVVHVRVRAANPLKRQIDFEVLGKVDTSETPPPPRPTDTPARPAGASPSGFWAPVFKPGTGGKPIKQKGGRGGPPRPPTDGSGPPKKRGSSKPKRGR